MAESKRSIGARAERFAKFYLIFHGYKILCMNYTVSGGEVDIIARKGKYLVFAEVKARRKSSMVSPIEAVNPQKMRHIINAATRYIAHNNKESLQPRFDVICIELGKHFCRVTDHIENAFGA